jgi:hypothetical protein
MKEGSITDPYSSIWFSRTRTMEWNGSDVWDHCWCSPGKTGKSYATNQMGKEVFDHLPSEENDNKGERERKKITLSSNLLFHNVTGFSQTSGILVHEWRMDLKVDKHGHRLKWFACCKECIVVVAGECN